MDLLPYMEQWHMLPKKGGIILCAVSGGRDSVCLLDYLCTIAPRYGFTVAAAHLNHLMRPTAQRDVAFLRKLCQGFDVPLYIEERDVRALAKEKGIGEEEAGRQARYDFLERTAAAIGAEKIATAHHRRDQAETVLLNLLRGTGPDGLGGIPPVREKYIRPLLDTRREDIEEYLHQRGLSHIEDETNESRGYARNRLRLDIWPQLEGLHDGITDNIARTALLVRRENEYLDELAAAYLPQEGTAIACEKLLQAPDVLQNRILRQLMVRLPSGKKDVTMAHVEAAAALAESRGMLTLPAGMVAVCDGKQLQFSVETPPPEEMSLHPGENRWGNFCITVDDVGEGLTVRSWESRDRMALPGSRGERSLKRLFAERGIMPPEREQVPVVCSRGRPCAVYGVGTSDEYQEKIEIRQIETEKA